MFGRATIRLGIGPHSSHESFGRSYNKLYFHIDSRIFHFVSVNFPALICSQGGSTVLRMTLVTSLISVLSAGLTL